MSIPDEDVEYIANISESSSNSENDYSDNNLALEPYFRGFEKIPTVQLQRMDISPYLKTFRKDGSVSGDNEICKHDLSVHKERLSWKCCVNLLRDDLLKIKESFGKNSASFVLKNVNSNDLSEQKECLPETLSPLLLKTHSPFPNTFMQKIHNGLKQPDIFGNNLESNLKCEICDKIYSSKKRLQNHQENKHLLMKMNNKTPKRVSFSDHVIVHEVTEYHKCRKCTKAFENYRFLKAHMKESHKKRKCYVCDYCHKHFMDRMFFKLHIKLHCDVCKLLLPNKSSYMEHRRVVCRVVKRYKCKTCNESFFKFMDLKDHSYEHISTYFICDICKDQFSTKCEVAHHIAFLHSENHPLALYDYRAIGNERLYFCNSCKESTVEKEVMEKHVAGLPDLTNRAMTGYQDFYFCDQCLMKFDKEKDMLQHKWTHFLKNSDNSQVRVNGLTKNISKTYNVNEKLPLHFQPKLVLEKICIDKQKPEKPKVDENILKEPKNLQNVNIVNTPEIITLNEPLMFNIIPNKAVVDPKSKKTIISKHQCQICGKFYSTNYCLTRHKVAMHSDYKDLQCKICEETFVWPSLLRSHKCIRFNLPEMPFDDARPEIHFENLPDIYGNGFDNLDISEDDYMNNIDFEIPAPIVELTEYEGTIPLLDSVNSGNVADGKTGAALQNLGFKIVMQEVPIEF